jgi:outer membrane protein OmpA-like peptidoglycan-associated protein
MSSLRPTICALALLILAGVARADDTPLWDARWSPVVMDGRPATLVLVALDDVETASVTLSAKGQKKREFSVKALPSGGQHQMEFPTPAKRTTRWTAHVRARTAAGLRQSKMQFDVASVPPLDVQVQKKDVVLEAHRAVVRANRTLTKADIAAFDTAGARVVDTTVELPANRAGRPVTVAWDAPEGEIPSKVVMKLYDEHRLWMEVTVEPFWVDIVHDDVEFETAKWAVRPGEAHKLDDAIAKIRAELAKHGDDFQPNIYVGGYTDTVGSPADNQALSGKRARVIARYFREKGLTRPIFWAGFGESALAVATADETEEARNRRAVYIIGKEAPRGTGFPGARWRRLGQR